VPRVYQDPIEKIVEELNDVDPFEDMVGSHLYYLGACAFILCVVLILPSVILMTEKRFMCTATVDRLSSNQRYWFASCSKCRKSAKFDGYQFICSGAICPSVRAALT
jgi:hypothetical protein